MRRLTTMLAAAVVFVVLIAEFFPLYFNTEAGARNINPILVDAARCFGAKIGPPPAIGDAGVWPSFTED